MTNNPREFDWSAATWEGAHREQLRRWSRLSFREKMLALEEMCDLAFATVENRKRLKLPYFAPHTGELVRPS
jgi:hypothetical protein